MKYIVTITLEQEADTADEAWESTLDDIIMMSAADLRSYSAVTRKPQKTTRNQEKTREN